MKKILIVSNTYYQLIIAIQLKYTIFKDDYVALALSDHSNNSHKVYKKLKNHKLFEECVFIKSKGVIHNRSLFEKIIETFQIIFFNSNRYMDYLKDLKSLVFDQVLFYNIEIDTYGVFSILAGYNKNIEFSSYEEGILSYDNFFYDSFKFRTIRNVRKLLGKAAIFDNYRFFFCVYPEIYNGVAKPVKIPQISSDNIDMKKMLIDIFEIDSTVNYSKYKYIYFESSYESNNQGIGEIDIFWKFVDIVGKENVLVKKHPRSSTHIFEDVGIAVDTNSAAPFEAIQLNCDMTSCTFVCTASGSVLTVNSIIDKPSKTFLLYPLTNYKKYEAIYKYINHVDDVLRQLKKNNEMKHMEIIQDLENIKDKL